MKRVDGEKECTPWLNLAVRTHELNGAEFRLLLGYMSLADSTGLVHQGPSLVAEMAALRENNLWRTRRKLLELNLIRKDGGLDWIVNPVIFFHGSTRQLRRLKARYEAADGAAYDDLNTTE